MANPFDLHKERLATTDEEGGRIFLHPSEVRGFFRRRRTEVYFVLMALFLILPWTKIGGVQTILLDIPHRRFSFFGVTFWGHDAPMVFFFLAGTAFSLALAASIGGRVWCGWACPQTVFIDIFYRRLESWIEGNALERRALEKAPMSVAKFFKRTLKWAAFTLITLVISHSFLAYFAGAERVLYMIQGPPEKNMVAFLFTAAISVILLFNFGWFREQFCIIMCPYGRLQGVLMDKQSLTVVYDEKRGEPRRSAKSETSKVGDCVDCYRCVAVCPVGIDIRRGQQLECIACTACIDACDEIMEKVKKPAGLIRYDRLSRMEGLKERTFRVGPVLYTSIIFILAVGFTIFMSGREAFGVEVLRSAGAPYADGGQGFVVNRFGLELNNTLFEAATIKVSSASPEVSIVHVPSAVDVAAGTTGRVEFFAKFPRTLLRAGRTRGEIHISISSPKKNILLKKELPLVGPME